MPKAETILERLTALHPKRIDLSLDRVERLLHRLGDPHLALPPVVHIAGTNGKGSTLALLHAMLRAEGRVVHRYISPHLVHFNERILIDGQPIEDGPLAAFLEECERANDGAPVTFFEITTAAAFLAFARNPGDLLLLETGLGGRLDATNVVPRPLLTLISPISMDHEAFLGDTLRAIAGEKAGILKPGVPTVSGPQAPETDDVLIARAARVGSPLSLHGRDWVVEEHRGGIAITDEDGTIELPRPSLPGVHQLQNAGLAIMAARRLGRLRPTEEAIVTGLMTAKWDARLQRLHGGPLLDRLGPKSELWLDGGHNPAAGEVLAQSLPAIAAGRPLHLVIGMLTTKDIERFMRPLVAVATTIRTVPVPGNAPTFDPATSMAAARALGATAFAALSVEEAIEAIADETTEPKVVLVCGSLYLAGHVLHDHR